MALMADKFLAGVQLWILAYLTTLILGVSNGATVGDTDQFPGFPGDDPDRLYLNTDRPATSNGIVTTVRYCYYGHGDLFQQTYRSLIALYRPVNESHYERISDTISITRRSYPLLPPVEFLQPADAFLPKFSCRSYRLTSSVQVLEGDIIGACIYNSGNTSQLDMITTKLRAGYQMMFEGADDAKCDTGVLPRVVGDRLQQDPSARILQISAEIFPDLFSNPAITTAMTTTAMTTTQATPNTTIIIPTEASPSNDPLLASVVGGALLGILILTIMLVIIMIIVMAIVRIRKRHNQDSRSERVLYHGNSSTNLILGDYEADVDSECDTLNFPHPYERAETVFTHAESQLVEYSHLSQSSSSENNYYTTCSSTPLTTAQRFYFTLEGPNCPYDQLLQKNKAEDIYANVEDFREPARAEMELYAQITSCGIRSIDQNSIQVCGHLGAGQFGNVEEGVWKVDNHRIKVALKTFNHSSTAEDRVKFLQEAAIMAQFKHPNVVCLYGIINNEEPITLVVQLVEKGDLRKHLLSLRPNPGEHPAPSLSKLLLSFSQHVALGMQYLSGKGFVHRDLAARNILVSKDNICKIADFGLSRDLANENYYISHGGKIPVKWTAPEAIHYKKYSTASDVWSYGCLLYEIWSLGYQPFEGVTNVEAVQFLKKGKRLSPPPGCPRAIYYIMIQCWNPTAAERPMFRNICLSLSESEQDMLNIPQEALDTNQFAGVLGSLLEAGERMYGDLKRKYEVHLD